MFDLIDLNIKEEIRWDTCNNAKKSRKDIQNEQNLSGLLRESWLWHSRFRKVAILGLEYVFKLPNKPPSVGQ